MFGKNNYEILSRYNFDYENFTLHLLKKSLMENFIFCLVMINRGVKKRQINGFFCHTLISENVLLVISANSENLPV